MTQVITKYAAKKILGDQFKKYSKRGKENGPESQYDPYFDVIYDERKKKTKKVKKQVPAYIPEKDAMILAKMRRRSYHLDMGLFTLFGIRFGWSSVIGLIPAIGDVADAGLALLLVWRCSRIECGLGSSIMVMFWNVFLDFIIGIVPFVGDLADAAYKANTRNVRVLEERLDEAYKPKEQLRRDKEKRQSWRGAKYDKDLRDKPPAPATVYEDFSDEEDDRRQFMDETRPSDLDRPQQARLPRETRGGAAPERTRSKGMFSGGSRRERRPDVEMGGMRREDRRSDRNDRRDRR